MSLRILSRPLLLLTLPAFLLLAACTDEPAAPATKEQVQESVEAILAELPDYAREADARKTAMSETENDVSVTYETINGALSPLGYYKRTLPEYGWTIDSDTTRDGVGELQASKGFRSLRVRFEAKPNGAGTTVAVVIEK